MTRLPFDPDKMRASEGRAQRSGGGDERPWTVSELVARIDHAIKEGLPGRVRVVGEISGLRERTHCWFDLKDADSVIPCVMFASALKRLAFRPETGQSVVVHGRIDMYAPQGRVQLYADRLDPVGAGALDLKLRQLVEELRGLGYLDPARKRDAPWFPRRIAVVTSRSGAALQDVLTTMRNRCPAVGVLIADVRVQGAHAAPEIARTIRTLGERAAALAIDAIVVTRGGGSMEDLWAFNERDVAGAIFESPIPVIAAIGHETDTTVAELVADVRCSTPTQAAMRITPDREELRDQCDMLSSRLTAALRGRAERAARHASHVGTSLAGATRLALSRRAHRMERLTARLAAVRPEAVYAARRSVVRELRLALSGAVRHRLARFEPAAAQRRLDDAMGRAMRARRDRISSSTRSLEIVSPRAVLRRGYSVTLSDGGKLVRGPADVRPGDALVTRLSDGEIRSTVDGGRQESPRSRRASGPPDQDEPGLFGS